jgi:hypothetical protein
VPSKRSSAAVLVEEWVLLRVVEAVLVVRDDLAGVDPGPVGASASANQTSPRTDGLAEELDGDHDPALAVTFQYTDPP